MCLVNEVGDFWSWTLVFNHHLPFYFLYPFMPMLSCSMSSSLSHPLLCFTFTFHLKIKKNLKENVPYVITLLNWTPLLGWKMTRLAIKKVHPNDTCSLASLTMNVFLDQFSMRSEFMSPYNFGIESWFWNSSYQSMWLTIASSNMNFQSNPVPKK